MQYLWINPVSAGMCEEDSLKRFLERHGLTRVECRGDWGRIVRERYEASLRAGVTLADARCPEAVRLLEEIQKEPENESGIETVFKRISKSAYIRSEIRFGDGEEWIIVNPNNGARGYRWRKAWVDASNTTISQLYLYIVPYGDGYQWEDYKLFNL